MRMRTNCARMRGMSLVEMLLAITLSVMLLAGAISIFMGSKETFNLGEDLSRVQESLRYASTRFINDIAPAGYMGCAKSIRLNPSTDQRQNNIVSTIPLDNSTPVTAELTDFSRVIIGGESTGPNGSDSLTVHYAMVGTSIPLITDQGAVREGSNFPISASNPNTGDLESGDNIIISDCYAVSAVQLTADPAGGELQHTGSDQDYNFGDTTQAVAAPVIYRLDAVNYQLIQVPDGCADDCTTVLTATRLGEAQQQILDGVEDFQLEYGIDVNGDDVAERYVNWTTVFNNGWQLFINSIRVTLTINPGDPVPNGQDPVFANTSIFTVALRNHGV